MYAVLVLMVLVAVVMGTTQRMFRNIAITIAKYKYEHVFYSYSGPKEEDLQEETDPQVIKRFSR